MEAKEAKEAKEAQLQEAQLQLKAQIAALGLQIRELRHSSSSSSSTSPSDYVKTETARLVAELNSLKTQRRPPKQRHPQAVLNASGRCQFFLTHKRRCCMVRSGVKDGYCTNHAASRTNTTTPTSTMRTRIACPINPKHTIWSSDLERHTKRHCPDRPQDQNDSTTQPSFFSLSINRGGTTSPSSAAAAAAAAPALPLHLQSVTSVRKLDERVKRLIASVIPSCVPSDTPRLSELQPETCRDQLARVISLSLVQANGASSASTPACSKLLKHCRQTASIVGHLERVGLTREPQRTTFIELGAGKATLSEMLAETAGRGGSYVLIDRDTFRNKRDKFILGAHKENQCVRHTIDIGNMNMNAINEVMERDRCVLISKHLCGVATCLALRAAVAMSRELGKGEEETKDCAKSKSKSKKNKMCGMALATCCHHRCIWDDYVNQEFFTSAGFSHKDFEMIRRTASWGTSCCLGGAKAASSVIVVEKEERREKISIEEKADIGLRCKMVLDIGRLLYLQSAGFECEMVRYVDGTLSPENRLLTATTFANAC